MTSILRAWEREKGRGMRWAIGAKFQRQTEGEVLHLIIKPLKTYSNNKKEADVLVCSFLAGWMDGWPTCSFIQLLKTYFVPSSKRADQEREVNQVDKAHPL